MAPPKQLEEPQWPPRSPREALLGTPGGRERYRQMANRTSPSPSPLKKATRALAFEPDEGDDEDEETLQLKLQEIQARLKLKKLQSARAKKEGAGAETEAPSRPQSQAAPVEIPASPVKRVNVEDPPVHTSPKRVLLGIDKGLTAKDVSLKRAPSLRRNPDSQQHQFGGYLQRAKTPNSGGIAALRRQAEDPPRPLSFNERLAVARNQEIERQEKRERVQQARTNTFGIGRQEMEEFKKNAFDVHGQDDDQPEQFSREEILAGTIPRSGTMPSLGGPSTESAVPKSTRAPKKKPEEVPEEEASAFEPYSSLHLKRRNIPHTVLTRHFQGKKIMTMKDLLRQVKAPDYELPDYEQDIVFFAIVAKRSEPRQHKPQPDRNGVQQPDRGKYMVVTLVDLSFELELFLFDTGFERYWKIGEGTVLAILNPTIMPPPKGRQDTGRFSITINSDEDRVIEIGMSRDLGFCKSVKRDGQQCMSWVNGKRTEFCEFHTNEAVTKSRGARVELNSWDRLGPGGGGGRKKWIKSHDVEKPSNTGYDRGAHGHWFASKSLSSADLIDGATAFADRREKEEGLKRRLLVQERERGIAERLGKIGTGTGKLYMKQTDIQRAAGGGRSKGSIIPTAGDDGDLPGQDDDGPQLNAAALGLLAPRSKDHVVHLGPAAKRKRPESVASSASGKPAGGFGWGGSLKDKLSRMKEGEKLQPQADRAARGLPASASSTLTSTDDRPPVRKKTRFITEKGIREAGRESLGDALPVKRGMVTLGDDDDDDDLVILR